MPALTGDDLNLIQDSKLVTNVPVLNIVPLEVIASADIAADATYPMFQLAVSNTAAWELVDIGRAFSITNADGTIYKTWGVVRKYAAVAVFYPDAKSQGDGGFARAITYPILAGDRLNIYKHRPAWGLISQTLQDGQRKRWDIPYTGQGSRPDPVCIIGTHQQTFVDPAGWAEFTIDSSDSYDWQLGTGGIASRLWYLPTSAEILSGSTTSPAITFRVPKGSHEIGLQVWSVNGRSAIGVRWCFANVTDPTDSDAPLNYRFPLTAISGNRSEIGREMNFTVRARPADVKDIFYPGAMCVFTNTTRFDGQELSTGAMNKTFVGHLADIGFEFNPQDTTVKAKFIGSLRAAKEIPTVTQFIEVNNAPTQWTQMQYDFAHPAFVAWYILRHHTDLLSLFDFKITDVNIVLIRRPVYGFRQENIGGQLAAVGSMFAGEITAQSDGTILINFEPNHQEIAARNALVEKYTWGVNDVKKPINLTPRLKPSAGQIIMDAVAWDAVNEPLPYRAIAPGYAQSQGFGQQNVDAIMVRHEVAQETLERIVGHRWAYLSNVLEGLELTLRSPLDILDPAYPEWHILDVPQAYLGFNPARFGIAWDLVRFRPAAVNETWEKLNTYAWTQRLIATARLETYGQRGDYLDVDRGGGAAVTGRPTGWVRPETGYYRPAPPDLGGLDPEIGTVFAWNDQGECAVTENFLTTSDNVNWRDARGGTTQRLTGKVLHAEWIKAALTDAIIAIALDEDTIKVYQCPSITALPPLWSLQFSETIDTADFSGWARVDTTTLNSFKAAAWAMTDGIYVRRDDNDFSGWNAAVKVGGGAFTDANITQARLGMVIEPGTQDLYISGMTANSTYRLFKATGKAGAFAQVANQPAGSSIELHSILKFDSDDDLWVSLFQNENLGGSGDYTTGKVTVYDEQYFMDSGGAAAGEDELYGFLARIETAEQNTNENIVYRVTAVAADFTTQTLYPKSHTPGPPPLPEQWPPFSDETGPIMIAQISLLDENMRVIWGSDDFTWGAHTQGTDTSWNFTYISALQSGDNYFYRFNNTYELNVTLPTPADNVAWISVLFRTEETVNRSYWIDGSSNVYPEFELLFSGLNVTTTDKYRRGRRLFTKSTSDVWTDKTPERAYGVGRHPESLALVTTGLSSLMIPTDTKDTKRRFIQTADTGANWQLVRDSSVHSWLKRLDDGVYVAGGEGRLDISIDSLRTASGRQGDWARSIGALGNFQGALILIEQT